MLLLFFYFIERYTVREFLKSFVEFCNKFVFLTGQFSDRNTAAFKLSLSCSSSLQSHSMWSTVCSPFLQRTNSRPHTIRVLNLGVSHHIRRTHCHQVDIIHEWELKRRQAEGPQWHGVHSKLK
jgi:hypothetical protein